MCTAGRQRFEFNRLSTRAFVVLEVLDRRGSTALDVQHGDTLSALSRARKHGDTPTSAARLSA
jgi:hypothetical protein